MGNGLGPREDLVREVSKGMNPLSFLTRWHNSTIYVDQLLVYLMEEGHTEASAQAWINEYTVTGCKISLLKSTIYMAKNCTPQRIVVIWRGTGIGYLLESRLDAGGWPRTVQTVLPYPDQGIDY